MGGAVMDAQDAAGWAYRANMTLGQGVELLRLEPFACACIGGPICCRYAWGQAKALQRVAHVAVRQMADLAKRRGAQ
jgi:hypothetical protein